MVIEIDEGSGFCFGVTRAIRKAEDELKDSKQLYCLGDIVHNGTECNRLQDMGLQTIDHDQFNKLHDCNVLLRAHGEPPTTYHQAKQQNIHIIDATCPVVLHLQDRIRKEYQESTQSATPKQIVIFGKNGHAEVLGLVGQTQGTAIVIESPGEVSRLDMNTPISLYSQTTMSLDGFRQIVDYIQTHISPHVDFKYADTICRQVANRMPNIRSFAQTHDVVLFVCGRKSSNGRVLYHQCRDVNPHSYMIESAAEIDPQWFLRCNTVGICGATSTPKWLMEECKVRVEQLCGSHE